MLHHSTTGQHQTKNVVATLLHFPKQELRSSDWPKTAEQTRLATALSALHEWHRLSAGPQTTRRALYWKFLPGHTEPQPQAATLEMALHRLVKPCRTVLKAAQLQEAACALSSQTATRPEAAQEGLDLLVASANRLHQNGKLLQQTLYSELKQQRQSGETGWQPRREGYWVVASNLSRDLDRDLVKLFSDYASRFNQSNKDTNKARFLQSVFLRLRPALAVAADLLNQLLMGGYRWDNSAFVLALAVFIELVLLVNLVLAWWSALADDCTANPPRSGRQLNTVQPTLFVWSPGQPPALFQALAQTLAQSELSGLSELGGWLADCPIS